MTPRYAIGLSAILGLASVGRLVCLDHRGFWLDELFTMADARGVALREPIPGDRFTSSSLLTTDDVGHVAEATIQHDSGNSILYMLMVHYWAGAFGHAERSLRFPSVLAGVLLVFLVFWMALRLASLPVAIVAALLAATHPFLLAFSREARAYALATVTTMACSLLLVDQLHGIVRSGWRRAGAWGVYGILAGSSLLLHYLTVYVFLGHALYVLLRVRDRRTWLGLLAGAAIAAGFLVVWFSHGGDRGLARMERLNHRYQQMALHPAPGDDWALPPSPGLLAVGMVQMAAPMLGNTMQYRGFRLRQLAPLLLFPGLLLVSAFRKGRRLATSSLMFLGILTAAGPIWAVMSALRAGHVVSIQPLYCNFAIPYVVVLMAWGLVAGFGAGGWLRISTAAATAGVALVMIYCNVELLAEGTPNPYRNLAAEVRLQHRPGDIITFTRWPSAKLVGLFWPSSDFVERVVAEPGVDRARLDRLDGTSVDLGALPYHEFGIE
jgi:uncharacterized membrane protein